MPWSPSPMAASSSVSHRRRSWIARAVQRSHASVTVMTVTDGTRATSSRPTGQSRGSLGMAAGALGGRSNGVQAGATRGGHGRQDRTLDEGRLGQPDQRAIRGIQLIEGQVHGHGRTAQVQQHQDAVAAVRGQDATERVRDLEAVGAQPPAAQAARPVDGDTGGGLHHHRDHAAHHVRAVGHQDETDHAHAPSGLTPGPVPGPRDAPGRAGRRSAGAAPGHTLPSRMSIRSGDQPPLPQSTGHREARRPAAASAEATPARPRRSPGPTSPPSSRAPSASSPATGSSWTASTPSWVTAITART